MLPSTASLFLLILCLLAYIALAAITIRKNKFGYIIVAFCIYHIVYLFLPAIFHTSKNIFPFYSTSYSEDIQIKTSLMCLTFTLFFIAGFFLTRPVKQNKYKQNSYRVSRKKFNLALIIISAILALIVLYYGIGNFLFARKDFSNENFGGDATTGAIIVTATRAASFLILLMTLQFKKSITPIAFYLSLAISIILFSIINFPPSLSRYLFFSYVLAILYCYTNATTKNKTILFLAFFIGTITVFPLFNFISRGLADSNFELDIFDYYTTSGDFDGYQSIINVVKYTEDKFFTFGGQLLGALFIFIPRSIWTDKPFATGQIAAENMGYQFTNISSPLISEIYIDFGYIGTIALGLLIGAAVRKIDSYSLASKMNNSQSGILLCAIIFSFLMITLRGALIGVASTIALELVMAFLFVKFTTTKNGPIRESIR